MPQIKNTALVPNTAIEAAAPDSTLVIDIDQTSPLKPGTYIFDLIVEDDSRNRSSPATVKIVVLDDQLPTAIIDAPDKVGVGKNFTLSGRRSTDTGGGTIAKFIWTLRA